MRNLAIGALVVLAAYCAQGSAAIALAKPTSERALETAIAGGRLEVGRELLIRGNIDQAAKQLVQLEVLLDGRRYAGPLFSTIDLAPIAALVNAARARNVKAMRIAIDPADRTLLAAEQSSALGTLPLVKRLRPSLGANYRRAVQKGRLVNTASYLEAAVAVRAFRRSVYRDRDRGARAMAEGMIQRDGGSYLSGALTALSQRRLAARLEPLLRAVPAIPPRKGLAKPARVELLAACLEKTFESKDRAPECASLPPT